MVAVTSVPMECAACGMRWEAGPKPDGTMPIGSRCPKDRGGCGKVRKLPRAAVTTAGSAGTPAAAWNPPAEQRQPSPVAGPCPHCGEARVYAEPRGTVRVCLGCGKRVTPPGVLAPYERGAGVTRAARSQRERDLEALDLAGRKGIMLGQLRALADGDRLDPASALKVEWFAEQVKAAANGGRLDELAALFSEARIRPRRWWHGKPAPLAAVADLGEDDADDDAGYDDDGQDDEPAAIVLATPASIAGQQHRAQPQRATWADGFAAYGWRLAPRDDSGRCPVISSEGRCPQPTGGHPPVTDGIVRDAWPCDWHYDALGAACISINQRRGIA